MFISLGNSSTVSGSNDPGGEGRPELQLGRREIFFLPSVLLPPPPGGSEWIISIGDYIDNSFTALGSSNPREVGLEL